MADTVEQAIRREDAPIEIAAGTRATSPAAVVKQTTELQVRSLFTESFSLLCRCSSGASLSAPRMTILTRRRAKAVALFGFAQGPVVTDRDPMQRLE